MSRYMPPALERAIEDFRCPSCRRGCETLYMEGGKIIGCSDCVPINYICESDVAAVPVDDYVAAAIERAAERWKTMWQSGED